MRAAEQRLFLKNGGVCQAVQECFKIPFPWNNILDCPAKPKVVVLAVCYSSSV